MNWKKIGIVVGVAFVLFLIIGSPNQAAGMVNGIFDWLGDAADSATAFFTGIG